MSLLKTNMKNVDIFPNLKLNLEGNNSKEKVPFITISNSKSNSSKNQNSSNNNKYSLTDNNPNSNSKNNLNNSSSNFERKRIFRKKNRQESSNNNSYSENSLIKPIFDTSFLNQLKKNTSDLSFHEDNKEVNTETKVYGHAENETPKKKYKKYKKILSDKKSINKAGKLVNFQGKNLMEYFEVMTVDVDNEEKKKNRVSSVENIPNNTIKLKKNIIIINKSWNKKEMNMKSGPKKIINKYIKSHSINKNEIKKIDVKKEKSVDNNLKITSVKKSLNNFDLKNLLNKYINKSKNNDINNGFANFQKKPNINNYIKGVNLINKEKKVNFEKIKTTPKSDSHKRNSSSSYLKNIESIIKSKLFHDYKPKYKDELNLIINSNKKIINAHNEQNQIKSNNIFDKILFHKPYIKIKPIKKETIANKNKINNKKINNYNESNSYFSKFKEDKEFSSQEKYHINKGFNYINKKK